STVRAWQSICATVGQDQGTMLEVFNEPRERPSPSAREEWYSGMQSIVNALRSCGAQNVLLLDGLNWGRVTAGLALPQDPLNRLAFAVHPYFFPGFQSPDV